MENTPSYYAVIPATVRYDNNLTANAKLLYGEITCLCNKEGYCWSSNSYFAKLYNVTNKTISTWISQLIQNGYIQSEIIRTESGEIEKRKIYLLDNKNVNTYAQNCNEGINKNVNRGINKNVIDNNTSNNNINISNINNKCVQSTKSSKSKISKKDKILKMVEKKCLEYDIEDEVIDKLFEFYSVLLDNNKLVSEQKVNADLSNLAKVNKDKQIKTINEALSRGWQSLNPEWLNNNTGYQKNTLIHHEQKIAKKNKGDLIV